MDAGNPEWSNRQRGIDPAGMSVEPSVTGKMPPSEMLCAALDASQDAVCFVDSRSRCVTHANPAAERLFGYSGNDWDNVTLRDLLKEGVEHGYLPGRQFVHVRVWHRDGHAMAAEWCLLGSSSDTFAVAIFRPLSVAEPIAEGNIDALTGLANRRVFERRLLEILEQKRTDYAVFFLDLDDFKAVNDRFGHTLGDQVLRQVAQRLVHGLRPVDTVVRYGGDEFVLLLEGIENEPSARKTVRRLLRAISSPIAIGEHRFQVSASVGIVLGKHGTSNLDAIIHAADRAMYRAKGLGPGKFATFDAHKSAHWQPLAGSGRERPCR